MTEHNNRGAKQLISWEITKLEAIAQTYPAEMREPFIWFASYVREVCNKNLNLLQAQVKELGHSTTSDTFSKILRGRWNTNADNQPLSSPVMNLNGFLEVVQ